MESWLSITLALLGVFGGIGSIVTLGSRIGRLQKEVEDATKENAAQAETMKSLVTREQLQYVIDRATEDRDKNSDQHKEFYTTARAVEGLGSDVRNMSTQLTAVQNDIRTILDRLPSRSA